MSAFSAPIMRRLVRERLQRIHEETFESSLDERWSPWCPQHPTVKQQELLACGAKELLFGGAAGGAKSSGLGMRALDKDLLEVPTYRAILFRKTYKDLALPGALMDRFREWLAPTAARWVEDEKGYRFPSGAFVGFGYMAGPHDHLRYQGAEFQFIGFDELTQWKTDFQYSYMFSRLRKLKEYEQVPLQVASATNPGGPGHDWVYDRFINPEAKDPRNVFIPSKLDDNPYLSDEYRESLSYLDPVTRRQLEDGDWDAMRAGEMFDRAWFSVVDSADLPRCYRFVRFWDLAATPKDEEKSHDPDWTVGVLLGVFKDGGRDHAVVLDVARVRKTPGQVEKLIKSTAKLDGRRTLVCWEEEGGASGKLYSNHLVENVLRGYRTEPIGSTGDKVTRAKPASAAAERGEVLLQRAEWNRQFLSELQAFPYGSHDDQVDAFSGAFTRIVEGGSLERYIAAIKRL